VLVKAPGGIECWKPVDVTVLPRYECAGIGEVDADGVRLLVRNNTSRTLSGDAVLTAAGGQYGFELMFRPERRGGMRLAFREHVHSRHESGGDCAAGGESVRGRAGREQSVRERAEADGVCQESGYARQPCRQKLVSDTQWREARRFMAYVHPPWSSSKPPMESLAGKSEVSVPGLPAVTFALKDRKYVPVSWTGQPEVTVDLGLLPAKKLYLLVIPFLDNHDTYSTVGRVDVRADNGVLISRTLRFPAIWIGGLRGRLSGASLPLA